MKIHFIGIGGIGSSALARYYLEKGHKVSGSDLTSSEITEALAKMGARIYIGHKTENIAKDIEMVLITPAINLDNPELLGARDKGIKIQTWEENLGELTKEYFTIAVSGAHGKTTTTALISLVLAKAGFDPTVIIGSKLKEFGNSTHSAGSGSIPRNNSGSNCRVGKSPEGKQASYGARKYLVIEADEYKSSFLSYWPKIIVLTSLEYEHPDYFENFKHYLNVFKEYLKHLEGGGTLVMNKDDANISKLKSYIVKLRLKTKNYSLAQKETKGLKKILQIPGVHNVSNALAALTVARILKIPDKTSLKALHEYKGAWRRFEMFNIKIWDKKCILISDYAHHPTHVKTTIAGTREKFSKNKIWAVYQPHQYLRTHYLFDDYVKSFDGADEIVLPEIYAVAGREKKEIMEKLSSRDLAKAIEKRFKKLKKSARVHFLQDYKEIPNFLKTRVKNNDVILLMGAGDIYKLVPKFN